MMSSIPAMTSITPQTKMNIVQGISGIPIVNAYPFKYAEGLQGANTSAALEVVYKSLPEPVKEIKNSNPSSPRAQNMHLPTNVESSRV